METAGNELNMRAQDMKVKVPMRNTLGFALGMLGNNIPYFLVGSYLAYFYTDVFLLAPAMMGVLFLSCRVWDAVNDPMMGLIADVTNTRWGRFRPYLLFAPFPVFVFMALTFFVPDLSTTGKVIWAFVTYFGLQMGKTALSIPTYALPALMTSDAGERAKISGAQQVFSTLGILLVNALTLPLVHRYTTEADGFFKTAMIFGLITAVCIWVAFVSTKKYDTPERIAALEASGEQKISLKEKLRFLFTNKPLMKLVLPIVITYIVITLQLGVAVYFFKYNLNKIDALPTFMALLVITLILGAAAAPQVLKRVDKIKTFQATNLLGLALMAVTFLLSLDKDPTELWELWKTGGLASTICLLSIFFTSFHSVILPTMVLDCVEYSEWKTGIRQEGLVNSVFPATVKAGVAVGGAMIGFGFSMVSYQPNTIPSGQVLAAIAVMFLLLPVICRILVSLIMIFYDLSNARHQQILDEIQQRKHP